MRPDDPEGALMAFLTSTYAAAAEAGGWDRRMLECEPGVPRVPRKVYPLGDAGPPGQTFS
ncbi:MAG: DUF5996 family protein [Shimia sp.]